MSQPVLIAILALAIAVVLTAAVALVTFADKQTARAFRLTMLNVVVGIAVIALQGAHLRVNFTGSMPIGVYSLSPLPPGGVRRGMLVAVCAPVDAAKLGRQRGYLAAGACPDDTELLLKSVAAVAGDVVDVMPRAAAVNGCPLPQSAPLRRDRSGRPLLGWQPGRYRLGPGQIWLYADNPRSWDSRYWGPGSAADALAVAVPLFTVGSAFRSTSGAARFASPASSPGFRIACARVL
ncbi:MAG: conjugative transfer signal peptidase TraF [Candidatus Tyrphobacter sp.]